MNSDNGGTLDKIYQELLAKGTVSNWEEFEDLIEAAIDYGLIRRVPAEADETEAEAGHVHD